MRMDLRNKAFEQPQVKEGDELTVKIEAVGAKGDGIAKIGNFVIFVPNTQLGETVNVRITKVLPKFCFGQLIP